MQRPWGKIKETLEKQKKASIVGGGWDRRKEKGNVSEKLNRSQILPGVSNLLVSLGLTGRRVVLGHTLNTL